jgi:phage gpG-like protein
MGTNLISLNLVRTGNSNRVVTFEDLQKYTGEKQDLYTGVAPTLSSRLKAKVGTEDVTTSIVGTNDVYSSVRNLNVTSGRFINGIDVERRQQVAVLGTYEVSELFAGIDPIGKTVKINGQPFTVIGVLEEKAKGKTILMSSHSFEEIEKTCDRVGIIRSGDLVAVENIHDLKEKRRKTYIVTFDSPASAKSFAQADGYDKITVNGPVAKVSILGNVSNFIKDINKYTVLDLDTESSSLEDIFMQYYGNSDKEGTNNNVKGGHKAN